MVVVEIVVWMIWTGEVSSPGIHEVLKNTTTLRNKEKCKYNKNWKVPFNFGT